MAERRFAREQPARERFVHDARAGRALAIGGGERAAGDDRDVHEREVLLGDDGEVGDRALRQRQDRTSGDAVRRARIEAGDRQADGRRRVRHRRRRAQLLDHLVEELGALRRSSITRCRHADECRRHAVGLEARRRPLQLEKAGEQQARADEQDDRQRDLDDDQRRAEASAALAGGAARAILERFVQRRARCVQRRREPDQKRRHERHATGERDRAPVHRQHGVRRQLRADERLDRGERPQCEQQADGARHHREDEALDEEVPHHARPRRAERLADGDLLAPRGQASEEERGDVGARDEQHESDCAEQRVERRLERTDQRGHEEPRLGDGVGVEPRAELLAVAARDRQQLLLRVRERHAGLQSRDGLRVACAGLHLRRREAADLEDARREHLHLTERRAHARRHDADDFPRLAVERDRLADQRGAAAESRLPDLVAQDAHRRSVRRVFVLVKVAAERRQDAERRQERRAHAQAVQLLGIAVAGQREVVECRDADGVERARVRADLLIARPRQRGDRRRQLRVAAPERDERLRMRNGDGVEDQAIVDREQCGVGADADRDRQHRDQREAGTLPQRAKGALHISHDGIRASASNRRATGIPCEPRDRSRRVTACGTPLSH